MSWGCVALGSAPLRPPLSPSTGGLRSLLGSRLLATSRGLLRSRPTTVSRGLLGSRSPATSRGPLGSRPTATSRGLLGSRPTATSRGLLGSGFLATSRGLAFRAGPRDGGDARDVTEPQVEDLSPPNVHRATWRRSLSPATRLASLLGPHSLISDTDSAGPEAETQDCHLLNDTQPNTSVTATFEDTQQSDQYMHKESQLNTTQPCITHTDEELQPNVMYMAKETQSSTTHMVKEMIGEGCEGEHAAGDDRPLGHAERCLGIGHLVLVENRKGNVIRMQKMLTLKEGRCLRRTWGCLQHNDLVGRMPGVAVKASDGALFVVRRPSLYEFTLFMPRTATIAYPKDVSAMLMHLDLKPGDVVLEAGTGSGAMTLMLSGAVWERGRVVSCDIRGDHLHVAQRNVVSWRAAYAQAHGLDSWPQNISFLKADVLRDTHLTQQYAYDAVVLDMLNVHLAVSRVLPALKPGGVIMIYVVNITQAVDVVATVQSERLPVSVELVLEVSHRSWVIIPALHKDGSPYTSPTHVAESAQEAVPNCGKAGIEKPSMQNARPFVCRPNSEQYGHTAFLIKLRKILPE